MRQIVFTAFIILNVLVSALWAQEKPEVHVGGALRFNYNISSFNKQQAQRLGDINYDMLAICPRVSYKGLSLNAEYRLYEHQSGGGMLRFGYIGYNFSEKDNLQVGLTRVPFGIEAYNSHSYFLGMTYYLGLEDDYDVGIKYSREGEHWDLGVAFFKNSDYASVVDGKETPRRYSYDVGGYNRETNQLNGKLQYKFGGVAKNRLGVSVEYGGLYNTLTEEMGDHYAAALHYELDYNRFNLKAQAATYAYNPKNPKNEPTDVVQMVAYNASYDVAAKANHYSLGAAYNIPVNKKVLSDIQFYNDFAYLDKHKENFAPSVSNTLGMLLVTGKIYTYVEYIAAKNHPWFGGDWATSFGAGNGNAKVEHKFNINVGYYF